MITVKKLMQALKKYPPNALVHAYEGECIGIVITSFAKNGVGDELGFIPTSESDELDKEQVKKESTRRKKKKQ
jgi:hypothetical protein